MCVCMSVCGANIYENQGDARRNKGEERQKCLYEWMQDVNEEKIEIVAVSNEQVQIFFLTCLANDTQDKYTPMSCRKCLTQPYTIVLIRIIYVHEHDAC